MTSRPKVLSCEAAGSSSRGGWVPRAALAGKAITRESAVGAVASRLALHSSAGAPVVGEAAQAPAVAGVVEALAQHWQALQPAVCSALAAQQQPPRHRLEAQSKGEAQASPGE